MQKVSSPAAMGQLSTVCVLIMEGFQYPFRKPLFSISVFEHTQMFSLFHIERVTVRFIKKKKKEN